jgi:hypothetical protein
VRTITLRITDDLHNLAKEAAGQHSLNAWIREAMSEKLGRSQVLDRVEAIERRLSTVEQWQQARS